MEIPTERRQQPQSRIWLSDDNQLQRLGEGGRVESVDWLAAARGGDEAAAADLLPALHETLTDTGVLAMGYVLPGCERLAEGEEDDRRRRFKISDGKPDRSKNIIFQNGWDLAPFKTNPVVLWVHNSWDLPIGQAVEIEVKNDALFSTAEFETYPFAQTILELLDRRTLRGSSVGARPKKAVYNHDRGGVDFEKMELLEWSVVPIPRNPRALLEAAADGVDLAPLREWCLNTLSGIGGEPGLWVPETRLVATVDLLGWSGGTAFFDMTESQIRELTPHGLRDARVEAARLPGTEMADEGAEDGEDAAQDPQAAVAQAYERWGQEPPWKRNEAGWAGYTAACDRLGDQATDQVRVSLLLAAGFEEESSALAEVAGDAPTTTAATEDPPAEEPESAADDDRVVLELVDGDDDETTIVVNTESLAELIAAKMAEIGTKVTAATGRAVIPD